MDFKLRIGELNGVTIMQVQSPQAVSPPVAIQPVATLRAINGAARASLEGKLLHGRLALKQSSSECAAILQELQGVGASALRAILGEEGWRSSTQTLRRFLQRELQKSGERTPVLWVTSPVDLPVEILPLLPGPAEFSFQDGRRHPSAETQLHTLAGEAQQTFLGMRFAIRRVSTATSPFPHQFLRPMPKSEPARVAFAPFCHMDFERFRRDMEALDALGCYAFQAPQPDRAKLGTRTGPRRLAKMLLEGAVPREEIVHVTAHCRTPPNSPFEHALVFGGRGFFRKDELPLTMEVLDSVALNLPAQEVPDGPLALLSACGANDVSSDAPTSLPEALLGAGYRAVVAPLVSLHVESARQVALAFFEAVARGQTVGKALVKVRRDLLASHGNPLALVYGCYGESRVAVDTESVRVPA